MSEGNKQNRINTNRIKKALLDQGLAMRGLAEKMNNLRDKPKEKPVPVSTMINGFENFTIDRFKILIQATGLAPNELLPWQEWVAEAKTKEGGVK